MKMIGHADAAAVLSIDEIWRRFDAPLRAFVRRRVGSREGVDDLVQEIYLRIHAGIEKVRHPGRVDAWIFQIARNVIIDSYRRKRPMVALDDEFAGEEPQREEAAFEADLREMVRRMVFRLPRIYRDAVSMTELGEVRQVEAARILGISVSGMKSRVQRGRRMLKEMLLECCHFELDRHGKIIGYEPRCRCCREAS